MVIVFRGIFLSTGSGYFRGYRFPHVRQVTLPDTGIDSGRGILPGRNVLYALLVLDHDIAFRGGVVQSVVLLRGVGQSGGGEERQAAGDKAGHKSRHPLDGTRGVYPRGFGTEIISCSRDLCLANSCLRGSGGRRDNRACIPGTENSCALFNLLSGGYLGVLFEVYIPVAFPGKRPLHALHGLFAGMPL